MKQGRVVGTGKAGVIYGQKYGPLRPSTVPRRRGTSDLTILVTDVTDVMFSCLNPTMCVVMLSCLCWQCLGADTASSWQHTATTNIYTLLHEAGLGYSVNYNQ